MPPKAKTGKDAIVNAALELVRESGPQAVNARNLAARLRCSTQPIFSNFASMELLQKAVAEAAHARYLAFLQEEAETGKYPRYKAFGMAYIRFAAEEKELFKLLFMCDRGGRAMPPSRDFEDSVSMIMESCGVSRQTAERMHLEMWACVHGIAAMQATSFLELPSELCSAMLSDVYHGLQARNTSGEKAP